MGYGRTSYGRGARSKTYTAGRVAKVNARPGPCRACGEEIPAGAGQLYRTAGGAWEVVHAEQSRGGWLMHPEPYRGGCPESTDRSNAELHAAGTFGPDAAAPVSERDEIAATARRWAESNPAKPERVHYGYNSRGRSRCEDAPCCGCCD